MYVYQRASVGRERAMKQQRTIENIFQSSTTCMKISSYSAIPSVDVVFRPVGFKVPIRRARARRWWKLDGGESSKFIRASIKIPASHNGEDDVGNGTDETRSRRCTIATEINLWFSTPCSLTYSRLLRMRLVVTLRFVRI